MTNFRNAILGMLAITTLLGVSVVAAAGPDLSLSGAGSASGGAKIDGSSQLDTVHHAVTDATTKVDGAVGSGVDASASATGKLDATTDHAGLSGAASGKASVSQDFHGAIAKVQGWIDQVFGHFGGQASANADANASGALDANQDGANAQGSFMGKLGAQLSGLFHL